MSVCMLVYLLFLILAGDSAPNTALLLVTRKHRRYMLSPLVRLVLSEIVCTCRRNKSPFRTRGTAAVYCSSAARFATRSERWYDAHTCVNGVCTCARDFG